MGPEYSAGFVIRVLWFVFRKSRTTSQWHNAVMNEERVAPMQALKGREGTHMLINEIYASIQGESTHAGRPCVFVRTTTCNLRCTYCDTAYAFTQGEAVDYESVLAKATSFGIKLIEITGGEPLLQPLVSRLARDLLARGFEVLCETSGALDITLLPEGVKSIVDIKTPGSGEEAANDYGNLKRLRPHDEVKFVLCSRADYEWARDLVRCERLHERSTVLFSCAFKQVEPADLARWINEDRLPVRLNLQLHKYIWPPTKRGV
jgi:7-carboxy-7-deazaguanine synthase